MKLHVFCDLLNLRGKYNPEFFFVNTVFFNIPPQDCGIYAGRHHSGTTTFPTILPAIKTATDDRRINNHTACSERWSAQQFAHAPGKAIDNMPARER